MGDKRNILTVELSDEEMTDLDSVRGMAGGCSRSAVVRQALKAYVEAVREQEAAQESQESLRLFPVEKWMIEYADGTRPFDPKTEKWDGKRAVPKAKPDTSERITYQSPYRAPDGSYPGSKPPPPSLKLPSLDGYAKEAAKSLGIEELD
jgi:predicted transcriptional regulator